MKVVFEFVSTKQIATKELNKIKSKFENAKIEPDSDNKWMVVLGECNSIKEANEIIHKAVELGYWGGIYNP